MARLPTSRNKRPITHKKLTLKGFDLLGLPRELVCIIVGVAFDQATRDLQSPQRSRNVKQFLLMLRWQTLCRALRAAIQQVVSVPIVVCTEYYYGKYSSHATYCRPFCNLECAQFFLPRLVGSADDMTRLLFIFFAQLNGKQGKGQVDERQKIPLLDDQLVALLAQYISWPTFCTLLLRDTNNWILARNCGAVLHDNFLAAMIERHCRNNMDAEKDDFLRHLLSIEVFFGVLPQTNRIVRELIEMSEEDQDWHRMQYAEEPLDIAVRRC